MSVKILFICLAVLVLIPVGILTISTAQQSLHGYGLACIPETVKDVPSPSGKWIARVRYLDCDAIAKDYFEEVVLMRRNAMLPALSKDYIVLNRDANTPGDYIANVVWKNDRSLEIQDFDCEKDCTVQSNAAGIKIQLLITPRI